MLLRTDNVCRQNILASIFYRAKWRLLFIYNPLNITWLNILQLKLGISEWYSPIFKTLLVAKSIQRINYKHTVAFIWCENMLRYFVLGHNLLFEAHNLISWAICSLKTVCFLEKIMSCGQILEHIFPLQIEAIVCLAWNNQQ